MGVLRHSHLVMPKGIYQRSRRQLKEITERIKCVRPKTHRGLFGEANPMSNPLSREKVRERAIARWKGIKRADPKFRQSSAMKKWAMIIKVRDNFTCQICGSLPHLKECVADHIKPYSLNPELALELSNGRTLCKDCHLKTPTYGTRIFFQ